MTHSLGLFLSVTAAPPKTEAFPQASHTTVGKPSPATMEASASASASSGGRSPGRTSRASTSFARNESASAGYLSRSGKLLKSGGERIQRAAVGSASAIYNVLLSVSRGFGSVRDSLRRRAPETDPFLKALEFRTRVHDEIGAMDAVDHAVLLKGSQFPKLNTATLQKFLIARKVR